MSQSYRISDDFSKENDSDTKPKICYCLTSVDIFRLILRIHCILIVVPLAFFAGIILLLSIEQSIGFDTFFILSLFVLSSFAVAYIFLRHYFIFKKQYFFINSDDKYYAEFSNLGLTIFQESNRNATEYEWTDFMKCHETKSRFYFYFKYDRAIIIKKQEFMSGNLNELIVLIDKNLIKYKKYAK